MENDRLATCSHRAGMTTRQLASAVIGLGLAVATATPSQAETWAERCAAEWRRGVSTSCEKAIEEDPRDLESRRNLARAFLATGDDRRALKAYKDITVLTPDDPMAHFNYGTTAGTLRRYHIAVEALRQAARLKPDFVEAHLVVAIALDKLGRFQEAADAKLRAAELGDTTAMYELAEYYASGTAGAAHEREALTWMERAANLGHIGAMDRMADIYFDGQLGQELDRSKAEEWFRRARNARR